MKKSIGWMMPPDVLSSMTASPYRSAVASEPGSGPLGMSPLPVETNMSPLASTTGGEPDCQMPAPGFAGQVLAPHSSLDHIDVMLAVDSLTPTTHPSQWSKSHWEPKAA